jgi:capsular exopolysaccharide synthesis family protein
VLQRLKEIGVAADARTSNIYVMGKAQPPQWPSYPDKRRTLLLGLMLGLAAGVALAFLLEQLDNAFKSPEEAERYMRLPNLAVVPDFSLLHGGAYGYLSRLVNSAKTDVTATSNGSHKELVLDHHPLSLVTEAYRSLRSSLLLSQAGGAPQTVLITSAGRGEGKTTTLINSAIVFAQMGCRVLIMDADLRRPRCHMLLKTENFSGVTELVVGQIDLQTAIRPTQAENLFFISSGAVPPNPAELLGSKKMHEILQQLRAQFEFIFIDSSPLMAVSDAVYLSTMVDGALLVVNRKTPKPLVRKARARLNTPHTKILGILLNRVDVRAGDYGSYYTNYYDYYPNDPDSENGKKLSGNGHGRRSGKSRANGQPAANSEAPASRHFENGDAYISLDALRAKLAVAAGPKAAMVLLHHLNALGESADAFPARRFEELVKSVSREILSHSARRRFEEELLGKFHNISDPPTDWQPTPATSLPPVSKKI